MPPVDVLGAVTALISAVGLLGVAISLLIQMRQTRISQYQSVRSFQLDLLRIAYDYPELHKAWHHIPRATSPEKWRHVTYRNMIFLYLQMNYAVGNLTTDGVRRIAARMFADPDGRTYWEIAGPGFEMDAGNRRKRRFFQVIQDEYNAALQRLISESERDS